MNRRKLIWLTLAALIVVGLIAYGFRPQPVPVSVAPVTEGPLEETVTAEGVTRVRERYVVSVPVPARVPRLLWDVGDAVAEGQPLVTLEPVPPQLLDKRARAEAQARVQQARAQLAAEQARLEAAQAAAQFASREYQRLRELRQQQDVSRSALEAARSEAEQAQAQVSAARWAVETAEQALRAARATLDYSAEDLVTRVTDELTLYAPAAGRVLEVPRDDERVVAAGEPLLTIGDPALLEVAVDVLSADAVRIAPGSAVRVAHWGGDDALAATVRRVEPAAFTEVSALGVEEQRVWVLADFIAPHEAWRALGDHYRVEAEFILWQADRVLQVPTSALFREGEGWAVFVVEEGRAHRRSVTPGRRGGYATAIVEGLAAGERVVVHPDDALADGVRVTVR